MARKRFLVEKRNVLNDIIAREFTLQELRLFSIYLSRINARDTSTRIVKLSLARFYKVMGLEPIRIEYLENVTRNLLTKVVKLPTATGGYSQFQLFKKCRVEKDDNGKWFFEINAHDDALELMFDYQRDYFTYDLWNVLNLESCNQVRMYELLKAYEKRGGERVLSVDELKSFLGIEEKEYRKFNDFKRFVLDTCKKALGEKTDITYSYHPYERSGRGGKIQSIRFEIKANENYINQLNLEELLGKDFINAFKREAGIEIAPDISQLSFITELSDNDKAAIMKATDDDVQSIRVAYDIAIQQGNIKNLMGFLIYMTGEVQDGKVKPPVKIERQKPKSRFVNFEQRDIDFDELERLELENFKESMKDDDTVIEKYQTAFGAF